MRVVLAVCCGRLCPCAACWCLCVSQALWQVEVRCLWCVRRGRCADCVWCVDLGELVTVSVVRWV